MNLRSDDLIPIHRPTGGGSQEFATIAEINALVSTEEAADIATLETAVGTYAGSNDLSTDTAFLMTNYPESGAPDIATAASLDITHDAINTAGKFITIGNKTYTFVAALTAPAVANEIIVADSVTHQADYLKAAINGLAGAGTTYGTGTVAHTQVTVSAQDGAKLTLTMKTKGIDGVTVTHDDNAAYDIASPTDLTGEVVGTVGETGKKRFNSTTEWTCVDGTKCTATDSSGWKYITYTG